MSREILKLALQKKLGEGIVLLDIWEIQKIIANLGGYRHKSTIQEHLRPNIIRPKDHGINPKDYNLDEHAAFYPGQFGIIY